MSNFAAVIYARYSPRPQEHSESVEHQIDRCRAYCRMRKYEIIEEIRDEMVSGGVALMRRPGGRTLASLLAKRPPVAHHLIMTQLDRAFRDTLDCLKHLESWVRRGVSLHLVDFGGNSIDSSTPLGKLLMTNLAAMGSFERENTRLRTSTAMKQHQAAGRSMGKVPPFGWALDEEGPRSRPTDMCPLGHPTRLKENAQEQLVIEKIVELRDDGSSYDCIAKHLSICGIQPRGKKWWTTTIRNIYLRAKAREDAMRRSQ